MDQVNLIDVTLLLAAAQGFFVTVLLIQKHRKPVPNRFLILLIFSYSVILSEMVLQELGVMDRVPYLIPIILGIVFIMVPSHYYYSLHLTRPSRRLRTADLLHLLPFVVLEGYQLIGMILGSYDPTEPLIEPSSSGISIFNFIILAYALTYMLLTLVRLHRHARASFDFLSNIERIHFRWLNNLTLLTIIILLVFTTENLLLLDNVALSQDFNLTSLIVAIFVYAINYQCLLHPEILVIPEGETRGVDESAMVSGESVQSAGEEAAGSEPPKYSKSGLSDERAEEIRRALVAAMEGKAYYRDPDLTLNDLAVALDVSPHNLSEVINTRLERNFFDFVNGYRIEQVKKDILDPSKQHLKMLAVAFENGFRSKSSFNLIFKKHVGMTPSEFKSLNNR